MLGMLGDKFPKVGRETGQRAAILKPRADSAEHLKVSACRVSTSSREITPAVHSKRETAQTLP